MQKTKLSPRHLSRSLAVQGLYHFQTNPKSVSEIEDFLHSTNEDIYLRANYEMLHNLLDLCVTKFTDSLNSYSEYSTRSNQDIDKIEQAILVIASVELHYCLSVPAPVIINESIELAKKFGGEESFRFINGLVDRLAHKTRASEMEFARRNRR